MKRQVRAWAAFDAEGRPIANTVADARATTETLAEYIDDAAPIGRVLVVDDRPEKKERMAKK